MVAMKVTDRKTGKVSYIGGSLTSKQSAQVAAGKATDKTTGSSGGGSSSSSSSYSASPVVSAPVAPNVTALNEARAAAVKAGTNPYAGNLKNLASFSAGAAPVPPVVATTSADRATFDTNARKVDERIANDLVAQAPATGLPGSNMPAPRAVRTIQNLDGSSTQLMDNGQNVTVDKKGRQIAEQDENTIALSAYDEEQKQIEKAYSQLKQLNDQSYNNTIGDIRNTYDDLRTMVNDSNSRYQAGLNQAGYASESFRYTPQITSGTIWAAEQEGIKRLMQIDQEENLEIAAAKLARDNNNYTALEAHVANLERIQGKRLGVIQDQYTKAREMRDEMAEYGRQSSRDSAIAGLVAQGISNPGELLSYLNYDDDGNQIGDFTLKEVSEALTAMKPVDLAGGTGAFKFDEKATASLLGNNISMAHITEIQRDLNAGLPIDTVLSPDSGLTDQQIAAVKGALGVTSGSTLPADKQNTLSRVRARVLRVLYGGNPSDGERESTEQDIIRYINSGMTEDQVVNEMIGLSLTTPNQYANSFRDIIIQNLASDAPKQRASILSLQTLLSNGNNVGAMNTVEQLAYNQARTLDPTSYVSPTGAKTYLQKVENIRTILAENGINGPIEGSFQKVLGRFKSSEAARLEAAVVDLMAQFRNDISGAAVTEGEARFLEPLIPSIKDKDSNFAEKLNAIQNRYITGLNSTRTSVGLPSFGENLTSPAGRQRATRYILYPNERIGLYAQDVPVEQLFGTPGATLDL